MPGQPGLDFSFDPELQAEHQAILQRQKIADLLMNRNLAPQQVQGRMSPFQGIAQVMGLHTAGRLGRENIDRERQLGEQYNTKMAASVQDYMRQRQGTPEIPQPAEELGGGPGRPAIPGDPKAAMINALTSRNPALRHIGGLDYAVEQKRLEGRVLAPDATWVRPPDVGGNITNRKPAEHAVPDGWERHVPANAKIEGRGTIRMKGADGLEDLYTLEFERGEFRGLKKLDNSPKGPTVKVDQAAPVTVTTVAHPTKPGETLQVDARVYRGGAEGAPGVIGPGAKLTQSGGANMKLELARPQAKGRVDAMSQTADRLAAALEGLHNHPGLGGITGTIAGRTPNLTNKATGAQGQLNSIKSQIFQNSLQAMREASKTGGAVGNVSDREGDKLERTIAALDQAMGTPEFKTELKKAIEQVKRSKEIINKAFEDQYGSVQNFVPPGKGAAATAVDAALDKYKD